MQKSIIKLNFTFALCAAFLIFSVVVPAFAASVNSVDKVPQVNVGYEFNSGTAPQLRIMEKNSGDFTSGDCFRLALSNAEWLEDEITTTEAVYASGANVDLDYLSKTMLEITIKNITGDEDKIGIRIPLLTKIIAEGEAKVTVDCRDSGVSSGTYVFAIAATGKAITTIERIEEFSHVGSLATIIIDETRIGALGNTAGQSIKLTLPPNFTWSKADEANFNCSGGLTDTVIKYKRGLNTRTLELSYDPPTSPRSSRGSIFLQGLQIQADPFAPCGDVVVDVEGTSIEATRLIVARHVFGSLAEAHLIGTITGAKKFPAVGIWEYKCNTAEQIWALELSVIEETSDGPISRNFTTVGSYSGAANGEEGFHFIHAAEMKMLLGGLEHTVYVFAWGNVSSFEVAFLPDTEDSKKQFFSVFGLDHESALGYIKNVIANSDDVVYGTPSLIYSQGQPIPPITSPFLIQISANSAVGGTVTGYGIYEYGNNITVIATPNSGYKFDNWSENDTVVSTKTAYTFNVTENRKLTANFSKISTPPSSGGGGGGGVTPPLQKQEKKPGPGIATIVEVESLAREIITKDGKTIESFTVSEEAIEQIEKAKKEGKAAVEIKIEKSEASVVAVSVPKDVLESIGEMSLIVNTPNATLELPKELVKAIKSAGQDLSIHVESGDIATVSEQMADVAEAAVAEILGTPTVINTEIRGNTKVSIPLSSIEIPKSAAERQAFLDTLRIFAVHSDGEKKIIEGTLEYNATGDPISINFTVDKFSTFAVIKMPEAARIGEPLEIKLIIGQLNAIVNGEGRTLDTEPFLKPEINRTMVPMRFIGEALGVEVIWMDERRQVVIKDPYNIIILTIDSDKVLVNNGEKDLDCPVEILPPGRTFVPLRFVSENLGAKVLYNTDKREVTIAR